MECKATGESVFAKEVLLEGNCEQAVDVDFTLPDYCPDIGRLLKCRLEPMITSREVSSDALTVEGSARVSIIYLDDRDKKIRCCDRLYPFKASLPFDNTADNVRLLVDIHVDYVNCRAVSQRKLDIHGAFTLHMTAVSAKKMELITDAEGEGLRLRKCRCEISDLVCCTQCGFEISEAMELGEGKPPVSSILRTGTAICMEECKAVANKLIVKGDAIFTMVYVTEQGDDPEHMEYVIPFHQFFDVSGVDENCLIDLKMACESVDVSLRTDADGEYRRLDVDLRAMADIRAYRPRQIEWITDAYSVAYETNCRRRQLKPERLCSTVYDTVMCKQTVDTGDVKIESLCDVWCSVSDSRSVWRDGKTVTTGNLAVCMIVRDPRQGVVYTEKNVRFDCAVAQPAQGQMLRPECRVTVKSCVCTLTGDNRVELQAELCVHSSLYEDIPMKLVESVELDETRPKSEESRPAAVLYFAGSGEELWDIAREYNSSVEAIRAENDIDGDCVTDSRLLIVTA
ncbi:MAG: DUF3794 domain-containing protein [Clostridia bacterium]|nr:DUF3794 domain-containing protein [Clostridia bacterium]